MHDNSEWSYAGCLDSGSTASQCNCNVNESEMWFWLVSGKDLNFLVKVVTGCSCQARLSEGFSLPVSGVQDQCTYAFGEARDQSFLSVVQDS